MTSEQSPDSDILHPKSFLWTHTERQAAIPLIDMAFEEDFGDAGDLTSQSVIPEDLTGQAVFVVRQPGVIAGLPLLELLFSRLDVRVEVDIIEEDGASVQPGTQVAKISGPMRSLLTGERTALNFLQRLSGIASLTRTFADARGQTKADILDTRKTTPGWRILEKYAVRCGGGHNHRMGLSDGILTKHNHLACLGVTENAISETVKLAREKNGDSVPIELEIDELDQLDEALAAGPDIILLDNMSNDEMREAVQRRDVSGQKILLEASGGITLERIPGIAATGVERISVGGLTHSAKALDIGLDYVRS